VDYGAIDGQPVSTLFTLISPTVRAHLHLLSRLGYALRDEKFKQAILRHASREEIFDALTRVETGMAPANVETPASMAIPARPD
jgi:PTS system nitrogen regulatory IIA component